MKQVSFMVIMVVLLLSMVACAAPPSSPPTVLASSLAQVTAQPTASAAPATSAAPTASAEKAQEGALTREQALAEMADIVLEDFTLETLDGTMVSLSDYKGKIVLLNFFQSWCPPCRDEMPLLEALVKDNEDVVVLAVAAIAGERASPEQGEDNIRALIKDEGYEHITVLLDRPGTLSFESGFAGNSIPRSYMIDREGILRVAYPYGAVDAGVIDIMMMYLRALDE